MLVTEVEESYIEDDEIIGMFPERYKGVEYDNIVPDKHLEVDGELGLEVVEKPSIEEKYGIDLDHSNGFHRSIQSFFDKNGFITDKQLKCFN